MSERIQLSTVPPEWWDLVESQCEGTISPDQGRLLNDLLNDNPHARLFYVHYLSLHAKLRWRMRDKHQLDVSVPVVRRVGLPWTPARWAALAAMIALAALTWILLAPESQTSPKQPSNAAPETAPPVATLTDYSEAAEFGDSASGDQPPPLGGALRPGRISLASGQAQIMFNSTAVVDLTGPCVFEMTGSNRGRLESGMLDVYVPNRARGFTVDLPDGTRIIDLGTRFTVSIEDGGRYRLEVIEGTVAAENPQGRRTITAGRLAYVTAGRIEVKDNADFEAPIIWRGPIDTAGPQSIDLTGALVGAHDAGGLADHIIEVPVGDASIPFVGTGHGPFGTGVEINTFVDTAALPFQRVLSTVSLGDVTQTPWKLNHLVAGRTYQVQVFFADKRGSAQAITAMELGPGTSAAVAINALGAHGLGQSAIGTFTAHRSTQTITIVPRGRDNVHVNAWILRDVTDTAQPGSADSPRNSADPEPASRPDESAAASTRMVREEKRD